MFSTKDASIAKLLAKINTPGVALPSREGLTTEQWLAACRPVLPRETWVQLAMILLA